MAPEAMVRRREPRMGDYSRNAACPLLVLRGERGKEDVQVDAMTLTVGKKPRVNTLSRLVLPHAPSPMMTSFLRSRACQWG